MAIDYRTKVRKLMAQAEGETKAGNEQAAQQFAERAAALATKHGIEDALTETFEQAVTINIIRKVVAFGNPYPKHRISLLSAIGRHFSCRVLKVGRNGAEVFGDERDVERVMFIYRLISTHMLSAAANFHPTVSEAERHGGEGAKHHYFKTSGFTPAEVKSARVSFVIGYILAVSERMAEAYKVTVEEAQKTNKGAALVLADRKALATKLVNETHKRIRSTSGGVARHAEGYYTGREASRSADIGQDRLGAGRRELSA